MPDIKYVCLSDMHLGGENSLLSNLTNDGSATALVPSPVLVQLVECLKTLILQNESLEKPTLVLNGDILELSAITENEAAMVFERFIELILPAQGDRLFKEIVYIPGNHDHHLWETAREAQYVNYISRSDKQKVPGSRLDIRLRYVAGRSGAGKTGRQPGRWSGRALQPAGVGSTKQ
jgi:metallophosphoesterase superfamily enzyme